MSQQNIDNKENNDGSEATASEFFGAVGSYQSPYEFIHFVIFSGTTNFGKD
jgi:hypothetical protein